MSLTLKELFDDVFSKNKFDKKFIKEVYKFHVGYLNQNREHMEFFGSNLLGVNVIRFKDSDVSKLFNDVYDVDYFDIRNNIKKVPSVNMKFKVSSDILNLTTMYVIHRILTSPLLNDKERMRGAYDAGLIFFYRCTSALFSAYFRYPADPAIAQKAYANLSNKYLIKKLGSWYKVMDYRSNDLIDKKGLHYNNLVKFTDDYAVLYAITDSQGRIRDLIKNYYGEYLKVRDAGESIGSSSSTYLDAEGEETIKEKTTSVENLITYLRSIIMDDRSFIKSDIIGVINRINSNTSRRMITSTLEWLSTNYGNVKYSKEIDSFITLVLTYSMFLLNKSLIDINPRDYPSILINLKNLYLSTRSTDPDLITIRDKGEYLIKESTKVKISTNLLLATRTSIILYITLRALVGKNSN